MVIQRWQSLLLLLAVALMCVFCLTPYGQVTAADSQAEIGKLFVKDAPVMLTVNILIAVLLFLSIFMYKNLRQQMKVTVLSMLLICVSLATSIFVVFNTEHARFLWTGGVLLLGVALLASLWAYRLMGRDLRLLRSYDRIR